MVDYEANREFAYEQADFDDMMERLENARSFAIEVEQWAIERDDEKAKEIIGRAVAALTELDRLFSPPDDDGHDSPLGYSTSVGWVLP